MENLNGDQKNENSPARKALAFREKIIQLVDEELKKEGVQCIELVRGLAYVTGRYCYYLESEKFFISDIDELVNNYVDMGLVECQAEKEDKN